MADPTIPKVDPATWRADKLIELATVVVHRSHALNSAVAELIEAVVDLTRHLKEPGDG